MAEIKAKQAEKPIKEEYAIGILRRTRNYEVAAPVIIDDYLWNGVLISPGFSEKSPNHRDYGSRSYPIIFPAGETEKRFDLLTNPIEQMQWEFLKKMSDRKLYVFNESYPLLELYIPEREARSEIDRYRIRDEADDVYRRELKGKPEVMQDFAIIFDMEDINPLTTELNLRQLIDGDPNQFLEAWNNPNKESVILANRAIKNGVIRRGTDGGYKLNDRYLGTSVNGVIELFHQEPELMPIIRNMLANR